MPDSLGRPVDNEGRLFVARARRMPFPHPLAFGDAAMLQCPDCRREEFRIVVADREPFLQIGCACGFAWMPMQMQKASMTNGLARRMGIPSASTDEFNTIESEFDLPADAA